MVVGKRINNNTTWKLRDESIEEVNEYTYLGYFVNRTFLWNVKLCTVNNLSCFVLPTIQ
jgi:hypothetical protein